MIFQFKIQISGISKPTVWRRIQVNAETSFHDFHEIIQDAFGWTTTHLYFFSEKGYQSAFQIQEIDHFDYDGDGSDNAKEVFLNEIFKKEKQTYRYIYDFGDDWNHKITLEKIMDGEIEFPNSLAGKGKCPPEDCGGVWGFEALKEILNNPEHPEYEENRDWLGLEEDETWDFDEFDLDEVNELLKDFA